VFRSHGLTGIDTGCVYGGALSALDTRSGELWQVHYGTVPRAAAR
jgi:hypothetical protein